MAWARVGATSNGVAFSDPWPATGAPRVHRSGLESVGDIMFLVLATDSTHSVVSVDDGAGGFAWTQVGTTQGTTANDASVSVFRRVVAASEPTNYQVDWSASEKGAWALVSYSGQDATTPLDVAVVQGTSGSVAASGTVTAGPSTPATNGCMVAAFYGCDPDSSSQAGTADASPAATERADQVSGTDGWVYVQDYEQATAAQVSLDVTLAQAEADGIGWFIIALRPAAGGQTIPVAQAIETDTAQPVGRRKTILVGQAVESSLAQPLAELKTRTVAQALESDTTQPVSRGKVRTVAQAGEADVGFPVAARKARGVAQAQEIDVAQPVSVVTGGTVAVNQAVETDTAQPAGRAKTRTVGQASEGAVALPLERRKTRTVGLALETSVAQAVGRLKARTVALAVESSVAGILTRLKRRLLGQPLEAQTAQAVTVAGVIPAQPPLVGDITLDRAEARARVIRAGTPIAILDSEARIHA